MAPGVGDGDFTLSATGASPRHEITVVLPTYKRPNGLACVLDGIAQQTDPGVPWSLVVVDNEEEPGAWSVFEAKLSVLPPGSRLVREREKGASHARNRGLQEVQSSIVAFIDDDVVPADDWLAALTEPILRGRCDGTAGRVMLDPKVRIPEWIHPHLLGHLSLFGEGDERELLPSKNDILLTANAAFLTAGVREIGGFDPALGPRPGMPMVKDDVDLFRRYVGTRRRVCYVPHAVVVHDVPANRLTPRYVLRRSYAEGRSDWLLDRRDLGRRRMRGAEVELRRVTLDLREILVHGYWRRDLAVLASIVSHVTGFVREAVVRRGVRPGSG